MTEDPVSSPKPTSRSASIPGVAPLAGATLPHGTKPPKPPAPGKTFDPRTLEKSKNNMLDSVMVLTYPASSSFSAVATNRVSLVAIANGLGNERPTRALISFSDDNQYMFIMPVTSHSQAIEIRYDGVQSALINLWKPFVSLDRTGTKGMREYYAVETTDEPVVIEGVKGFALWVQLVAIDEQPIKSRKDKAPDVNK